MRPIFYTTMGFPGAGKSYFAKKLSHEIAIVRINSDSMRQIMFSDPQSSFNKEGYHMLFGAMDYAASEIVKAGFNVIYDAKCNRFSERKKNRAIAEKAGGIHVTIWVQAAVDHALERSATREATSDQLRFSAERVAKHAHDTLDEPDEDEQVVIINGFEPFEEQFKSFQQQLALIVAA